MKTPTSVEEILTDLVGFATPTQTANADLLHYVSSFLEAHGVASQIFWASDSQRGNLLATIGPADRTSGVVLSGHTDVIPVDTKQWKTDPFVAVVRDGRIYGRGTSDMKGFIASVLAAVPTLISMPLTRPIHIVLTYDEEIDCAGMREFLETSEAVNLAPQAVILGEPTDMELVIGHRGHYRFETIIRGSQAHGGNAWQGANAIAVAGELISYLYSHYPGLQATDPASAAGTTSINVGIIEGGELFNIVAGNCRIEWELRPALGVDGEAIIEEFERHCREVESVHANRGAPLGVETAVLESYPEYRHEPESAVVALVRSLTAVSDPTIVGYGTEAPFYQERGMPVVIMGPGSINQAHQPNEYTEITQLHACTAFIQALAQHVAA